MKAYLTLEKRNLLGKDIQVLSKLSESFLIAFPALLTRQFMQYGSTVTITNIAGNELVGDYSYDALSVCSRGGSGREGIWMGGSYERYLNSDQVGIVIGSNSGVVQPQQNTLITPIRTGEGAGKVNRFGTTVSNFEINVGTNTGTFDIECVFRNNSGGTITVREVGVYARGEPGSGAYPQYIYDILRDIFSDVEVLDGEYLKVKYIIQIMT